MQVAAAKSRTLLISILALTAIVLAGVAAYSLAKLSAASSVVRATPPVAPPAPPVVQAPAAPPPAAPPVTQTPSTPTVTVTAPPQIVAYLAFVQQMEQERNSLEDAQVAAMIPALTAANGLKDPTEDQTRSNDVSQINQAYTQNLAKWQGLIKQFQAQTPPAGCEDLANAYYKLLQDYTDVSSQIQVALESGDIARAMSLQSAQSTLDADAAGADSALSGICTKFNAKKLFVISTGDGSAGTSLIGG